MGVIAGAASDKSRLILAAIRNRTSQRKSSGAGGNATERRSRSRSSRNIQNTGLPNDHLAPTEVFRFGPVAVIDVPPWDARSPHELDNRREATVNVDAIDHLVMNVRDVERTCRWYEQVLGMQRLDYGDAPDRPRTAILSETSG